MSNRKDEMVTVIGPIDTAPGKHADYKPRKMSRRLAEKKSVKKLGIAILEDVMPGYQSGDKITVDTRAEARYRIAGPPEAKKGRKSNAEKELEAANERIAKMEAQLAALTEPKKDADKA